MVRKMNIEVTHCGYCEGEGEAPVSGKCYKEFCTNCDGTGHIVKIE